MTSPLSFAQPSKGPWTCPATNIHKNSQSLWLIAKKNILRRYILKPKSTHIAQSLDVISKNRSMAINKHLLSGNDNSNAIRKMVVCNLQTFKLTVALSGRRDSWRAVHSAHFLGNSQSSEVLRREDGRFLKARRTTKDRWMDEQINTYECEDRKKERREKW